MAPMDKNALSWQQHHSEILVRGMIQHLLLSRPTFYRLEGLHGEVDNHGGNRISQKVIEVCKKMAKDAGMEVAVVQEIINQSRGSKGVKRVKKDSGGHVSEMKKVKKEM